MGILNKFKETIGWNKKVKVTKISTRGTQQSVDTRSYMMNLMQTFEQPEDDLEIYHLMASNIPIMEGAINAYTRLTNTGFDIKCEKDSTRNLVWDILERLDLEEVLNKVLIQYNTYGFCGVEIVLNEDRTEVVKLKVIDSRTLRVQKDPWGNIVCFKQIIGIPTGENQNSNMAPGTITLDPDTIMYFQRKPDSDSAYGVSLLRPLPFVASVMMGIEDSIGKIYRQYGAPKYHVKYTPNSPIPDEEMEKRMDQLADDFSNLDANSDFFSNGDVEVSIIGAGGQQMNFSNELAHIMQEIMSGLGLPANVLGFNYGSTETHAKEQNIILMSNIRNTQNSFKRILENELLMKIAQVYDLDEVPEIEFEKIQLRDEVSYQSAEQAKLSNTLLKRDMGIISQDDAAIELGYRKPYSQNYEITKKTMKL